MTSSFLFSQAMGNYYPESRIPPDYDVEGVPGDPVVSPPLITSNSLMESSQGREVSYSREVDSSPLPTGEVTATVLLGALLAILGNNLLKPLFAQIMNNIKSDSEAPEKLIGMLTGRLEALEKERTQYIETSAALSRERAEFMEFLKRQAEENRTFQEAVVTHSKLLEDMVGSLRKVEEVLVANQAIMFGRKGVEPIMPGLSNLTPVPSVGGGLSPSLANTPAKVQAPILKSERDPYV